MRNRHVAACATDNRRSQAPLDDDADTVAARVMFVLLSSLCAALGNCGLKPRTRSFCLDLLQYLTKHRKAASIGKEEPSECWRAKDCIRRRATERERLAICGSASRAR